MATGEILARGDTKGYDSEGSGVTVGSTGRTELGPLPCPIGGAAELGGLPAEGRRRLTTRMGKEIAADTMRSPKKADSITEA